MHRFAQTPPATNIIKEHIERQRPVNSSDTVAAEYLDLTEEENPEEEEAAPAAIPEPGGATSSGSGGGTATPLAQAPKAAAADKRPAQPSGSEGPAPKAARPASGLHAHFGRRLDKA